MIRTGLVKIAAKCAVGLIIVFFLVRSVALNWTKVRGFDWSFDPALFALSCAVYCAAYAFLPWIWGRLLRSMGYRLSYPELWHIYYIGNLGRYVPGKVWTIAGMAYMGGKAGIPSARAGAAAVFSQVYSLVSSVVIFLVFLILREDSFPGPGRVGLMVLVFLAGAFVFVLFPRNVERMLNTVLGFMGRKPLEIGITTSSAVKIIVLYGLSWILFGAAFHVLIVSIAGPGTVDLVFASGVWAAAYTVGFLAFFVPGGLGVREGVIGLFFVHVLPVEVGIVIAGISRLVVTGIELGCVFLSFLYRTLMER